jgi:mRNA-degrading endonuclease RelE of RelBE toxin-antitoxin system
VSYQIRYMRQALTDLRDLPGFYRHQAKDKIQGLSQDPYPPKSTELRELPTCRRVWLGRSWRIIYQVDGDGKILYVLGIRPKNAKTYQDLELAFEPRGN